ncbi:MAG TPA: hypothetical protein VKT82_30435 [Ktedonobacterales bacterium]|nr:hypothetical protein [Ktedonobacterales bacterium]
MRPQRFSWAMWLSMVGLLLLLCAGGGGSTPSSTSTTSTNTPSSSGNTHPPTQSTVSFTTSGGLTGAYTISDTERDSSYRTSSLTFIVQDQTWLFTLGNASYAGPGASTLTGLPTGYIGLQSVNGAHRWQLAAPSICQMTVTTDTALPTGGGPSYHEVKGTFSCPSLASQSEQPLTLSNGQFDIVALVVS